MSTPPTMKDVAEEAGVALSTVSKVINGLPVRKSSRVRVEAAARKLGYQVNQYARGLRASKTHSIALIVPEVDHPFFAALIQHVCTALTARDYRMLLYVTAARPDTERACINTVRQNRADGIIALTYNDLEIGPDLPFVSIDRCLSSDIPCVSSDNYQGGRMAAEKLLELGCRQLAFLRTGSVNLGETDKRGDGFEAACRARQIPFHSLRVNDGEDAEKIFREFFEAHMTDGKLDVDGIFCSTDRLAWRLTKILTGLGIRVPEDLQIIGYDGIRHMGRDELYCSTIVQPVKRMAELCVSLLLDMDRSQVPSLSCLPVSYMPGGTTRE